MEKIKSAQMLRWWMKRLLLSLSSFPPEIGSGFLLEVTKTLKIGSLLHVAQQSLILLTQSMRIRMVRPQLLLKNTQSLLVEHLCLSIFALLMCQGGQPPLTARCVGMIRAKLLLPDRKSTLEQQLRLLILALYSVESRQIVQAQGRVGMFISQLSLYPRVAQRGCS